MIVVKGVANPACPATGPGPFLLQSGCDRARHHRPARRVPACRAGRPPRSAPPEHRHRRRDRAARRRRRPGRAPGGCALSAAAPGSTCSCGRLRAAVLITAHARAGGTSASWTPCTTPANSGRRPAHSGNRTRPAPAGPVLATRCPPLPKRVKRIHPEASRAVSRSAAASLLHIDQYEVASRGVSCLSGPGRSRYQNSGSCPGGGNTSAPARRPGRRTGLGARPGRRPRRAARYPRR